MPGEKKVITITLDVSELLENVKRDQKATGIPSDLQSFVAKFRLCISQKNSKEALTMLYDLRIKQIEKTIENLKAQKAALASIRTTPILEMVKSMRSLPQVQNTKAGLTVQLAVFDRLISNLERIKAGLIEGKTTILNMGYNIEIVAEGSEEE